MRYPSDHKAGSRQKIVRAAAEHFRRNGIDSVGVVPLMKAAGLTHGAFYAHFKSKDALVEAVLEEGLEENFQQMAEVARTGGLEALVDLYLSPLHRDNPQAGCPAAALAAELARHATGSRKAFTCSLDRTVRLIEGLLPHADRQAAQAVFSAMVGSLVLARSVSDRKLSENFLASGRAAALTLAGVKSAAKK
jgi:TetR/AcrR family transcriptional repressor of nem operon